MKVIVTGGAGYIGSTICSALSDAGHTPIVWDSLVTGEPLFTKAHLFYKGDIASRETLEAIHRDHPDARLVIHCAARIIVPESVAEPFLYYSENVAKSLMLFKNLREHGIEKIVFSSSASVYAQTASFTVNEEAPRAPQNPYAKTKAMMEDMLIDFGAAYKTQSIILRYFNPIGADPQMRSGPFVPNPTHLLGRLVQVAKNPNDVFSLTGCNWPTRDGSGLRDFIHVWDLALAHVKAVERFDSVLQLEKQNYSIVNVGTGNGVTVKEFVAAFEAVAGKNIRKQEAPPRPGDNAGCHTVTDKAQKLLGWQCASKLEQGIASALQWAEIWAKKPSQQAQ